MQFAIIGALQVQSRQSAVQIISPPEMSPPVHLPNDWESSLHRDWIEIKVHAAPCDYCNKHNKSFLYKCTRCARHVCEFCIKLKKLDNHLYPGESIEVKGGTDTHTEEHTNMEVAFLLDTDGLEKSKAARNGKKAKLEAPDELLKKHIITGQDFYTQEKDWAKEKEVNTDIEDPPGGSMNGAKRKLSQHCRIESLSPSTFRHTLPIRKPKIVRIPKVQLSTSPSKHFAARRDAHEAKPEVKNLLPANIVSRFAYETERMVLDVYGMNLLIAAAEKIESQSRTAHMRKSELMIRIGQIKAKLSVTRHSATRAALIAEMHYSHERLDKISSLALPLNGMEITRYSKSASDYNELLYGKLTFTASGVMDGSVAPLAGTRYLVVEIVQKVTGENEYGKMIFEEVWRYIYCVSWIVQSAMLTQRNPETEVGIGSILEAGITSPEQGRSYGELAITQFGVSELKHTPSSLDQYLVSEIVLKEAPSNQGKQALSCSEIWRYEYGVDGKTKRRIFEARMGNLALEDRKLLWNQTMTTI